MQKMFKFLFQRFRYAASLMILLSALVLVIGCGGGDDAKPPVMLGTFVDSTVSGLNYKTAGFDSTTSASGSFNYIYGLPVTFSIGNLVLGSATGAETLSPLSLFAGATITIVAGVPTCSDQRVSNILILLQTLDEDGDVNNGIQITDAIRAIVSANAASINFNQTTTAFSTSIATLMTALNGASSSASVFSDKYRWPRTAKSATFALSHFVRTIGTRVTVTTKSGELRGFEANATTWQWLGVPYAQPPVEGLRWKPPQNPVGWTGVREATEYGDQAAQAPAYASYGLGGVSENCLTLNITAPKGASNLPVMVWFHGGAFGILTANSPTYGNPTGLTTKGVVLVNVNHRLGVFGYLAHPLLTMESGYGGSGNYGQLDLIKALEFVRDNIAAFGGNPANVTLFGQSGGGGKAISLMASSLSKGLFHKVICQSGFPPSSDGTTKESLAVAEAKGTDLFTRLGVTTLAQARAVPWLTIVNADLVKYGAFAWVVYAPNIDNHYLTDSMENLIKAGLQNDVPFLAGANSGDLVAGVNMAHGITQQMPWRATYNKANQFIYYWKHVPAGWAAAPYNVSAYHGLELVYVFNYPGMFVNHLLLGLALKNNDPATPLTYTDLGLNPLDPAFYMNIVASTGYGAPPLYTDVVLGGKVMTIWTNFAKNSNPSTTGVIDSWPVYTTASDAYVEIGTGGIITSKTGVAAAFGTP